MPALIDDENPWADAAANNERSAKSSLRMEPNATEQYDDNSHVNEYDDIDPGSCRHRSLRCVLHGWHLVDAILGLSVLIYGFVQSSSTATVAVFFLCMIGSLLSLRALTGGLALSSLESCQRLGLSISAQTSPVLALTWLVLCLINLCVPSHVRGYLEEHHLLWQYVRGIEEAHPGTVTLLLLVGFIVECARWQLVQRLSHQLQTIEHMSDSRARQLAEQRRHNASRPWWWPRYSQAQLDPDDPLTESLLPVGAEANNNDQESSGWNFFGGPRRSNRRTAVRDDASVDFASVQEEWASRTEEDPFWWSRDEDERTDTPPTREVSWHQEDNQTTTSASLS